MKIPLMIKSIFRNLYASPRLKFLEWLSGELSVRMAENLKLIKMAPKDILVINPHDLSVSSLLRKTYPKSKLWRLSVTLAKIRPTLKSWFYGLKSTPFDGDGDLNSAKNIQFDLLWASSWSINSDKDWKVDLQIWHEHLKSDGLLMFSYLGPDTALEYRHLFQRETLMGLDMHDIGDGLMHSGFSNPVMDMEYLKLTYQDVQVLLNDLQSLDLIAPVLEAREKATLQQALEMTRGAKSHWELTLEVVYGHAWRVSKRVSGEVLIRPEDIKRRT